TPELPTHLAVPYIVLPDKINPANGTDPSLPPVKLCRIVKPEPSVLTLNTVPLPELPPDAAVPKSVLLDMINPASGLAPSLPVKLCRVVQVCAITRPAIIKHRPYVSTDRSNAFLM